MKKPTEKIIGYCSHWDNEQHAWVTEIPVSYLESLGYYKEIEGYCLVPEEEIQKAEILAKILEIESEKAIKNVRCLVADYEELETKTAQDILGLLDDLKTQIAKRYGVEK